MGDRGADGAGCSACGLALPPRARFCGRCGARLQRRARGPVWVLVLLWLGVPIAAGLALGYTLGATTPELAGQPGAGQETRAAALAFGLVAGALCCVQLAAAIGLTAGWSWARVAATLVCVPWALTCLGLPVALLVLNAIWRPLGRDGSGGAVTPVRPPPY